jgi:hypothetical protein
MFTAREKVFAKQKQHDKSTTTIAIDRWMAAFDSGRRIDPGGSVQALARPQEEGAHQDPHKGVVITQRLGKKHN